MSKIRHARKKREIIFPSTSGYEFLKGVLRRRNETQPLRVMILGGYGVGNLGDESILSVIVELIRRVRPNASIYVPSHRDPDIVKMLHKVDSGPLFSLKTLVNFFRAEVLVIGAGDFFSREIALLLKFLPLLVLTSKRLFPKKTIAYFSIGFYQDTSPVVRNLVLASMVVADAVSVRDPASLECVRPISSLKDIQLVPYLPMNLKPIKSSLARRLLHEEGVNMDKFLVGLSLRYFSNKVLNDEIEKRFSWIIDQTSKKLDVEFVFFPFDTSIFPPPGWWLGDQFLAEALHKRLKHKDGFTVIKRGNYTPEEMKGMVGNMDLFISMRVIPLVLAYSMKVPSITIPCLEKNLSFANMVGLTSIPLEELSAEVLMHIIDSSPKKKEKTSHHKYKKHPSTLRRAFSVLTVLSKMED